jgi:hypothetical protein
MFFPWKDLALHSGAPLGSNQYHSSQTLARCGSVRRPYQTTKPALATSVLLVLHAILPAPQVLKAHCLLIRIPVCHGRIADLPEPTPKAHSSVSDREDYDACRLSEKQDDNHVRIRKEWSAEQDYPAR